MLNPNGNQKLNLIERLDNICNNPALVQTCSYVERADLNLVRYLAIILTCIKFCIEWKSIVRAVLLQQWNICEKMKNEKWNKIRTHVIL